MRRDSKIRKVSLVTGMALSLGLIASQAALAAAPGSFSPVGAMGHTREGPAAAPLPDGRVLVAGGFFRSSAETFDPIANTFSSAGIGAMGSERGRPAAAPLPDGRVLVVGGDNGSTAVSSAEIFDPATNTFSSAGIGAMGSGRTAPIAAPLPDGRVLVAGGYSSAGPVLASAEVFNPATNTFTSAGIGSMGTARGGHAAAPLPDGRVLIAGGIGVGGASLSSVEVFNPATNTFSSAGIGSMGSLRAAPAAAPLPDGRVLVAGGYDDTTYLRSAEVFDPATNTFSSARIGAMATARAEPAAAPLPYGRVLVAGGFDGVGFPLTAEVFKLDAPNAGGSSPVIPPPTTGRKCKRKNRKHGTKRAAVAKKKKKKCKKRRRR